MTVCSVAVLDHVRYPYDYMHINIIIHYLRKRACFPSENIENYDHGVPSLPV